MLVLAHTDGLGIDLDQFGKRVHQPPPDGHRTAHRQVVIREFPPGGLGGRINRGAGFIDHHHLHGGCKIDFPDQGLGLPPGRAVAHGHGFDFVFFAQELDFQGFLFRPADARVQIDGVMVEKLPLTVQAGHLAAGPVPRVDAHNAPGAHGRGQKQLPQVVGKHPDGFLVGPLPGHDPDFGLHGIRKQALVSVFDRLTHQQGILGLACHKQPFKEGDGLSGIRQNTKGKHVFGLPPADGQEPVRGDGRHRLFPRKIIPVLAAGFLLAGNNPAPYDRFSEKQLPQAGPGILVFIDHLRDDVFATGQGRINGFDPFFRIHITRRRCPAIHARLFENGQRQGLQPFFPRHNPPRATLRLIGQINVFELGKGPCGRHPLFQRIGQVPVFFQGMAHRLLARGQFPQLVHPLPDGSYGDFIKASRGFLAVPRDKRDACPFGQKASHGGNLADPDVFFAGNGFDNDITAHGV